MEQHNITETNFITDLEGLEYKMGGEKRCSNKTTIFPQKISLDDTVPFHGYI